MTPPLSDHFNGKTFFQPTGARAWRRFDLLRWRLTAKPKPWPPRISFALAPPLPAPKGDAVVVTWIGHATFLIRTARESLLIDPVFSKRASPFSWIGPQRMHPPGIALSNLPPIDVVLLSHDHYDHCDSATLQALARKHQPRFIAPLRHGDLLRAA